MLLCFSVASTKPESALDGVHCLVGHYRRPFSVRRLLKRFVTAAMKRESTR